ncbi:hypothetical protein EW146_g9450 [Bondarzewia mesenterica]|uniref:AAA+ ATPase domain-containing protein n=1 Tax=Bondarzewia mesenterica TaxID=1095465 RepID=A0A4S4L6H2_9AGAM|nr:hypothetical protein EW146_g9450 [Bondarzewia mesenterica]
MSSSPRSRQKLQAVPHEAQNPNIDEAWTAPQGQLFPTFGTAIAHASPIMSSVGDLLNDEKQDDVISLSSLGTSQGSSTPVKGARLELKKLDKLNVPGSGEWQLFDTASPPPSSKEELEEGRYSGYAEYALILRRKVVPSRNSDIPTYVTKLIVWSEHLRKAIRDVLKGVRKVSWNAVPLKVFNPQLLLAFLPHFKNYLADASSKESPDDDVVTHVSFLIDFLETEYSTTVKKIHDLVSHGEITFDLLWAIFPPLSIVFTSCPVTSEPRAVRLQDIRLRMNMDCSRYWTLRCEYVDATEESASQFGLASITLTIPEFDGVAKIVELSSFPFYLHPNVDNIRMKIVERGRKWVSFNGVHHMQYNGVAYKNGSDKIRVNGRIMIDRGTFANFNPNYERQSASRSLYSDDLLSFLWDNSDDPMKGDRDVVSAADRLKDDDLLLTSPIVYGFGLVHKQWLEFNVENVSPIQWNDEAFKNLSLEPEQKLLVESLIESHAQDRPIDDFIEGKGLGLVINLFGPPGVGKSLTVEATSEHLRQPLYVVGGGDLGTNASTLDRELTNIFALVPVWNAVVLIDEADVFLEERASSNLERNAMVAVFLRQIEYFRGILFLTTNRVQSFDQAFQSRIHLSLHYSELSREAKEQIWRAFLEKVRKNPLGMQDLSLDEIKALSERDLNGRQIKNIVKIATSLAQHKREVLSYGHLIRTIDITETMRL